VTTPQPAAANSNSGIINLSDGVRSYFYDPGVARYLATNGVTIPEVGTTGWRQRESQLNSAPTAPTLAAPAGQVNRRVLFMPGTEAGDEGKITEPRHRTGVGDALLGNPNPQRPRTLATWERIVTAWVWAVDTSDRNNEQKQIAASDNLLELVIQALQWFAQADFVAGSGIVRRPIPATANLPMGREILYQFVHREPVFAIPVAVVPAGKPNVQRSPAS
jgi:hypothetical protein